MTDRPFQRPGSASEQQPESWPHHSPSPTPSSPPPAEDDSPATMESGPSASEPPTDDASSIDSASPTHRALWRAPVVAGVAGFLVGITIAGLGAALYFAKPAPATITPDTFPEYVLGIHREDLAARSSGDSEALTRFDANFEAQIPTFQFVHGGPGATVGYGESFTMTIVDGRQSLPLPSDSKTASTAGSPTLVSLESARVSCVFLPSVGLYDSAVLASPADLTAKGRTDCVLNDRDRNLSLRITSLVPGGATETADDFAQVLEDTHTRLTT